MADIEVDKLPQFVYGLDGICELFQVKSRQTASRYVHTWLEPAVIRKGNKIMVNTKEALRLFGEKNDKNK